MIDIHTHILPGIDDGAKDNAQALSLLQMAEQDGTSRIICTPHIHFNRFENTKELIEQGLLALKESAAKHNVNIELAAACELRIDAMMLPFIKNNKIPYLGTVNGKQHLLLELPHSHVPPGTEKLISWLSSQNIQTIIAHPERNRDILKTPQLMNMLKQQGCLFQLTANSITGGFGEDCQALAHTFLADGLIDVVASDAHNLVKRPPILSEAFNRVSELLGQSSAEKLFITTPGEITASLFSTDSEHSS